MFNANNDTSVQQHQADMFSTGAAQALALYIGDRIKTNIGNLFD